MKQFVKALDEESAAFTFLQNCFHKLSETVVKACGFVGPQIKNIMASNEISKKVTKTKEAPWKSFIVVVLSFLRNHKAKKTMWNVLRPLARIYKKF